MIRIRIGIGIGIGRGIEVKTSRLRYWNRLLCSPAGVFVASVRVTGNKLLASWLQVVTCFVASEFCNFQLVVVSVSVVVRSPLTDSDSDTVPPMVIDSDSSSD